ncbi:MAG: hypothetical protein ABEK59_04650 [Halobacteria archaeon]
MKCDHCGYQTDSEEKYLDHLEENHYDELSRIEERKVEDRARGEGGLTPGKVIVGIVVVAVVVIGGAYFVISSGGDGGGGGPVTDVQPGAAGSTHTHGLINVTIDGKKLDFSKDKYQHQDRKFHFENGDGSQWHGHATKITPGYALDTLGIEVHGRNLSFDGKTYRDSNPNTTVDITVNGREIDPASYIMKNGDSLKVVASQKS